jgi:hypothetical protein
MARFYQTLPMLTTTARLLHRAWLTLWKPVPELINILGVEVPDSPAVSLAGIKVDAITLHWTRPEPNKTVLKYLIQVNGVNGKIKKQFQGGTWLMGKWASLRGWKLPSQLQVSNLDTSTM